jgi:hypothetical protein
LENLYTCVNRCAKECCLLGEKSFEYPKRFFASDYAGNRLEFSLYNKENIVKNEILENKEQSPWNRVNIDVWVQ